MMNKWEQWLKSRHGKGALDPGILKRPEDIEYLKNRLWWAFHAGNYPIDGKLTTEGEALMKRIVERPGTYIPARLKRDIKRYLESA